MKTKCAEAKDEERRQMQQGGQDSEITVILLWQRDSPWKLNNGEKSLTL